MTEKDIDDAIEFLIRTGQIEVVGKCGDGDDVYALTDRGKQIAELMRAPAIRDPATYVN